MAYSISGVPNLFLILSEIGLDDIDDANRDLTNWFIEYNNLRPHETLDYLTPLEYAQEHYFKVSPMWSASTIKRDLFYYSLQQSIAF